MDLDDLDNLLDMEEELMEEGAHKRSRADLQSQAEAAASLAVAGEASAHLCVLCSVLDFT